MSESGFGEEEPLAEGDPVRVGPYLLLNRLGADAAGRLYLAQSPGGRRVAVKVVDAEVARDPAFRARLRREVAAAQLVSGGFAVPVVGADTDATTPWVAAGHLAGRSLKELIAAEGPPSADSAQRLAAALAEALGALHRAGVLHGDLRPSTILVRKDGPRLIDFAVPRALAPDTVRLTAEPPYTAPERLLGAAPSEASDIYALGAVLYFMATGRAPRGRGGASALDRPTAHPEPDLSRLDDDLLRDSISACLATDPARRPTAESLLVRLHETLARPPKAPGPDPDPDPDLGGPPTWIRPWPRLRLRLRRPASAVHRGVGALALLAAICIGIAHEPADSGTRRNQPGASSSPGAFWSLTKGAAGDYVGLWTTPSSVVLGTTTGLTAYDPATRAKVWSWLPPRGSALCAMSRHSSEGIGALTYGTDDPDYGPECDHLQTISLSSGTLNWAKAVTGVISGETGTFGGTTNTSLSIGNGTVTASLASTFDSGTDLINVALHTGTVNWSTDYDGDPMPNECVLLAGKVQEFRGTVYTLGLCDDYTRIKLLAFKGRSPSSASTVANLSGCDPTGDEPSPVNVSSTAQTMDFLVTGANHLLIGCSADLNGDTLYTLRADSAKLVPVISTGTSNMLTADSLNSEIRMFKNTLYFMVPMDSKLATGVVAVNMDTGKQLWAKMLPNSYTGRLLTAEEVGVKLLAYDSLSPTALCTLAATDSSTVKCNSLNPADAEILGKVEYPDPQTVSGDGYLALGFPSTDLTEADTPVFTLMPPNDTFTHITATMATVAPLRPRSALGLLVAGLHTDPLKVLHAR
ncbi:serine/threonine-protein kinase [Streptomyces sp. MZ04]|uniref:serine/threonine protein kinase n=1 Tax=Streptomyces sp. MZ04 TaxID=2559236 RepID=UPI00107E7C35|nr:serine/threonine-protein kinase [Streptomyces sp. MZ04]TGB13308.1 serine/threonine protein kinase [Streptomyces sp. MZ04]